MASQSSFPKLFDEYYAIHETIYAILGETDGNPMEPQYVAQRIREKHPDLNMGPATLLAAIKQAMKLQRAEPST